MKLRVYEFLTMIAKANKDDLPAYVDYADMTFKKQIVNNNIFYNNTKNDRSILFYICLNGLNEELITYNKIIYKI